MAMGAAGATGSGGWARTRTAATATVNTINLWAHSAWDGILPGDLWLNGGGGAGGEAGEGQFRPADTVPALSGSGMVVLGLVLASLGALLITRRASSRA
jgi:hypothetical protein